MARRRATVRLPRKRSRIVFDPGFCPICGVHHVVRDRDWRREPVIQKAIHDCFRIVLGDAIEHVEWPECKSRLVDLDHNQSGGPKLAELERVYRSLDYPAFEPPAVNVQTWIWLGTPAAPEFALALVRLADSQHLARTGELLTARRDRWVDEVARLTEMAEAAVGIIVEPEIGGGLAEVKGFTL